MSDIEIYSVRACDSDYTIGYQAKGHVDEAAFIEELRRQFALETDVRHVEHCYRHYVPVKGFGEDMDIIGYRPGRGWSPITWVDSSYAKPTTGPTAEE